MGYFRKKLDRGRSAAAKRAAATQPIPDDLKTWLTAEHRSVPRDGYIRLAVSEIDRRSNQCRGLFRAAGRLEETLPLSPDQHTQLRDSFRWFNRHLISPRDIPAKAIFWFKCDAADCMGRIWDIVLTLQLHDVPVQMLLTRNPGSIVYEDDLQIAAIPFRESDAIRAIEI